MPRYDLTGLHDRAWQVMFSGAVRPKQRHFALSVFHRISCLRSFREALDSKFRTLPDVKAARNWMRYVEAEAAIREQLDMKRLAELSDELGRVA